MPEMGTCNGVVVLVLFNAVYVHRTMKSLLLLLSLSAVFTASLAAIIIDPPADVDDDDAGLTYS